MRGGYPTAWTELRIQISHRFAKAFALLVLVLTLTHPHILGLHIPKALKALWWKQTWVSSRESNSLLFCLAGTSWSGITSPCFQLPKSCCRRLPSYPSYEVDVFKKITCCNFSGGWKGTQLIGVFGLPSCLLVLQMRGFGWEFEASYGDEQ